MPTPKPKTKAGPDPTPAPAVDPATTQDRPRRGRPRKDAGAVPTPSTLTEAERVRYADLWARELRAGATLAEVARKYAKTHSLVARVVKEAGVSFRVLADERRREALAKVAAGQTLSEVAAEYARYGLTESQLRNAARAAGVDLGDTHGLKYSTYEILASLFDPAQTLVKIAVRHGVSVARVSKVYNDAKRAGVPVPRRARCGGPAKDADDPEPTHT